MWDIYIKDNDNPKNDKSVTLFGKTWTELVKDDVKLTERGQRFALWIKEGGSVTAEEARGAIDKIGQRLSVDEKYLLKKLDMAQEWLELMPEVLEIAEMAREEFWCQEKYRMSIRIGIDRLIKMAREKVKTAVKEMTVPHKPTEQYRYGFLRGQYEAWAHATQWLQEIIDQAALDVARDKQDEETEDRQ